MKGKEDVDKHIYNKVYALRYLKGFKVHIIIMCMRKRDSQRL